MAKIIELPTELLLKIFKLALINNYDSRHLISNLSRVCRRFNGVCGYITFATYKLYLRSDKWSDPMFGWGIDEWNIDRIKKQLAHLRIKSPHVRHIHIMDVGHWKHVDEAHPPPFPPEIVPSLLETLSSLHSLVSIAFEGYSCEKGPVILPQALWEWAIAMKPSHLLLKSNLAFPENLRLWDLDSLEIAIYNPNMRRFVEAFKARDLRIRYPSGTSTRVPEPLLIYPSLRSIFVEINMLCLDIPEGFFDFTTIPTDVSLELTVRFDVEFKFHIPGVWVRAKRVLPSMFVDDLTKFDVYRVDRCGLRVKKPHVEYKGVLRQEHAPDLEAENKEAEDMEAHYERRRRLWAIRGY